MQCLIKQLTHTFSIRTNFAITFILLTYLFHLIKTCIAKIFVASNGPKEQLGTSEGATGSEEFEPWRSQQQNSAAHTAYGTSVPSSATDIYNMSTAGNKTFICFCVKILFIHETAMLFFLTH